MQTVAPSWLEIQVQHNYIVAAKATLLVNLSTEFNFSVLCDRTHFDMTNLISQNNNINLIFPDLSVAEEEV